eukprot:CAMPEP_0184870162 /NCGR_PEP_ID=MMETSP0580-20130426/36691_1 /TAXON_ID=1118495 /ORGANISM="Dactyliosolen fragilissimus" /LENGTH=78 /DNA_ID=CAMNT_0027372119 /DNA_START=196 /DNA_END=432 /DNA_ORIENTATION=-
MAIRLQSVSASIIMCVVMIMAFSCVANDLTRSQIELRVDGSRPVVGSSKRRTLGEPIKDIAMVNLLLIPPDNDPALRV